MTNFHTPWVINPPFPLCLPMQIQDANRFVSAEFILVPNRFLPLIISKSSINRFFRPSRARSHSLSSFRYYSTVSRVSFLCKRECGPRVACSQLGSSSCLSSVATTIAAVWWERKRKENARSMHTRFHFFLRTFVGNKRSARSFSLCNYRLALDLRRLDGLTEKNDVNRSLLRRFLSDDTEIVLFYTWRAFLVMHSSGEAR